MLGDIHTSVFLLKYIRRRHLLGHSLRLRRIHFSALKVKVVDPFRLQPHDVLLDTILHPLLLLVPQLVQGRQCFEVERLYCLVALLRLWLGEVLLVTYGLISGLHCLIKEELDIPEPLLLLPFLVELLLEL
mmetsp:Transcript_28009/g.42349  ORF Transcript_28009/g.42349 Transcript_28009/m.42349 type:complete len:131 (-) Transcript_28009:1332-1724(-)